MLNLVTWILARLHREDGQDLIEYAALGGLIAAALAAVLTAGLLSGALNSLFTNMSACVDFDGTTPCLGGI